MQKYIVSGVRDDDGRGDETGRLKGGRVFDDLITVNSWKGVIQAKRAARAYYTRFLVVGYRA